MPEKPTFKLDFYVIRSDVSSWMELVESIVMNESCSINSLNPLNPTGRIGFDFIQVHFYFHSV